LRVTEGQPPLPAAPIPPGASRLSHLRSHPDVGAAFDAADFVATRARVFSHPVRALPPWLVLLPHARRRASSQSCTADFAGWDGRRLPRRGHWNPDLH